MLYGLSVAVNNFNVVALNNLSWSTVNPAGNVETVGVQADANGDVALHFFQTTPNGSQASPIIDDVTLSTVPDGATTAGLLGISLIGLAIFRRQLVA